MRYSPFVERISGESVSAWDIHYAAVEARGRGEDVIVLSVGDPDFATTSAICETAVDALRAGDRNPYSWNMDFYEYPDGSGYEARFSRCGICTLMQELGLQDLTPALVKTLADEQFDDIERRIAILRFGLPFNEVIGRKREDLVDSLPQRLSVTMKGGRIAVRARP